MKAPIFLAAGAGLAVLALAMRPAAVEAQGGSSPAPSPELTSQCASCHALTRPADTTVEHLWNRKGPDLWYAGDKFNREWLVGWRSEEHTSALQSLMRISYAVFCSKKKRCTLTRPVRTYLTISDTLMPI